ncbi:unknown [Clostridium sp. CAG:448]|nr:unknown [Clostridium sp. CAG:448]
MRHAVIRDFAVCHIHDIDAVDVCKQVQTVVVVKAQSRCVKAGNRNFFYALGNLVAVLV